MHDAPRFEGECGKRGFDLAVLPPRRPQWNGCGRGLLEAGAPTTPPAPSLRNFLDCDLAVETVSRKLLEHEFFHNEQRPHRSIGMTTPNEFYDTLSALPETSAM